MSQHLPSNLRRTLAARFGVIASSPRSTYVKYASLAGFGAALNRPREKPSRAAGWLSRPMLPLRGKPAVPTRLSLTLGAFVVVVTAAAPALAAPTRSKPSPETGQALEVSPTVNQLAMDPGKTVVQQIRIRNISKGELVVSAQVNDFVPDGETGLPKLLLEQGDEPNPRSIQKWVTLPASIRLVPREAKVVPVRITAPRTASPGSHYGVIRFTGRPPGLEGQGVSMSASIGVLEFIRINGQAKESLKVEEFFLEKDEKKGNVLEATPATFIARLKNDGNVDVTPSGQIEITNVFGKKVAALNVNLPPRMVLPDSIRRFEQPLDKAAVGDKVFFGKYTAKLNLTYGEGKKPLTSEMTFWVIPYKLIAAAIIIALLLLFLGRFLLKRYNAHIIRQAGRKR